MNITAGDRVKMTGTHYVGTVQWIGPAGIRCGVRWDGFAGVEDLAATAVEKL